tara:strand:+ start:926 stop:3118 length:2193 start_codon:yes stop_codon:yes gene_type:complete
MKKLKVIIPIITILILIILFGLSFLRLPVNLLSQEIVDKETKGLISLNSLSNQTLKILPKPILSLDNSSFKINHEAFQSDITANDVEISRSIFNKKEISIKLNQASIENTNSNLINNAILLEGDIENLKLNVSTENNSSRIITNKFNYKGSDLYFDIYTINSDVKKIGFTIDELEIDELVLLLDENYQQFFKKINFESLSVSGEYSKESLNIKNLLITLEDKSQINIKGTINLNNLINSDLTILGQNISTDNLFQLLNNIQVLNKITSIPRGIIETFDLSYNVDNLLIKNILYKSDHDTIVIINGTIEELDIENANINTNLTSKSKVDIYKLLNFLPDAELLKQFKFDEIQLSSIFKNDVLKLNELIINNKNKRFAKIDGEYDFNDVNNLQLNIQLDEFDQFNLIPSNKLNEFLSILNTDHINIRGMIEGSNLKIKDLVFVSSDGVDLSIAGNLDLNNYKDASINIGINNLNKEKLIKIISKFSEGDFSNIINIVDFDYLESNLIVDLVNNIYFIENLDLIHKDKISNISGSIKNKMFTGLIELKEINLAKLDSLFLNTSRIKGNIDLSLTISDPISFDNIQNISGNINGSINVNVSEEEFALVLFVQSLSQDIEDFEQINELLNTLANSFINQIGSVRGQILNKDLNEFQIKDLILSSPDGETMKAELELTQKNFKITIFDIIDNEDFVIKYQNGSYSYERIIPDGTIKKPIEELIQKNINKLFENLLQ